jgi:hypothetical protein
MESLYNFITIQGNILANSNIAIDAKTMLQGISAKIMVKSATVRSQEQIHLFQLYV